MSRQAWRQGLYRWELAPPHPAAEELARQLHVSPIVAQVLANRGLCDTETARSYLDPRMTDLIDPQEIAGMQAAAERLALAVRRREPIVIYGDYDVDGMTGTAILLSCLKMLGHPARFYVPHRLEEGYGVNAEALRQIASDGTKLVVTVDCGIRAAEAVAEADHLGMEMIVTDHHAAGEELPSAAAVAHPSLPGRESPNPDACGATVAMKLAWQTLRVVSGQERLDEPMRRFMLDATCLAALGTIADVVPLVGENRVLATFGLRGLPATRHVGLRALLEAANIAEKGLDAYHVAFVLAPRLNAAGRMGHAREAIELLTTDDPGRAGEIARDLNRRNEQRQKVEREIAEQAGRMVVEQGLDDGPARAIVLASENWHGGVIGIVASRLVEQFARPAVLIAIDEQGRGQGSARSVPGFHMAEALRACGEHLLSFGGHAMAGGLKIARDRIEPFREAFGQYACENVDEEQLRPSLRIDADTTLGAMGYAVVHQLSRLEPYGQNNPRPLVLLRNCTVINPPKRIGRRGRAVSMTLGQNGTSLRAVGFGMGDLADAMVGVRRVDVVAEPSLNEFRGRTSVELHLRDVRWE